MSQQNRALQQANSNSVRVCIPLPTYHQLDKAKMDSCSVRISWCKHHWEAISCKCILYFSEHMSDHVEKLYSLTGSPLTTLSQRGNKYIIIMGMLRSWHYCHLIHWGDEKNNTITGVLAMVAMVKVKEKVIGLTYWTFQWRNEESGWAVHTPSGVNVHGTWGLFGDCFGTQR